MPTAFTFADLFAGCGGLSLGLSQAGGTGVLAVEKSEDAFSTLRRNLVHKPVVSRRMEWPERLPEQAHDLAVLLADHRQSLEALKGDVDVVAGGPPCQGFSIYGDRQPNDLRNSLYRRYIEFVQLVQPRAVILENVEGINMPFIQKRANSDNRTLDTAALRIQKHLRRLGYQPLALRLCASNFGVPQFRPRFFIIGIQGAGEQLVDAATSDEFLEELRLDHLCALGLGRDELVSSRDAISDLEVSGAELVPCPDTHGFEQIAYLGPLTEYQRAMRVGVPAAQLPNSLRLPRHAQKTIARFEIVQSRSTPGYRIPDELRAELKMAKFRLHWMNSERPAPTITTLPDDFIHYAEPRILTVRECARLQSFPDSFEFLGRYTTGGHRRKTQCPRYTQVGNAVPPRVAQFLGTYVQELMRMMRSPKWRSNAGPRRLTSRAVLTA
jgi:DNA (cytosine-5)-methyltransferase 1